MATAKLKAVDVPVILELSPEEARTLLVYSARVGGNPEDSPRRHADAIQATLQRLLGPYGDHQENALITGGVRFADYPA